MEYKRHVSFLVILTLILIIPITGDVKVYAEDNVAVVDMGKVSGDVIITSDGINVFASTSGGIITSGSVSSGGITITGETTIHQVTVSGTENPGNIPVTLSDAAISLDNGVNKSPLELTDSANVEMTLKGDNSLISTQDENINPGLGVGSTNVINITGGGSLHAESHFGAGIGGKGNLNGNGEGGSNISVGGSVSVTAISYMGAGIGGGVGFTNNGNATGGAGEDINISDRAMVNAESVAGAGIGGGMSRSHINDTLGGAGKNINISDRAIVNTESEDGAGIGGGYGYINIGNSNATGGVGENINISDHAMVTAESSRGAGIGGGCAVNRPYSDAYSGIGGSGENISVSDSATVIAKSSNGAGIGGGYGNSNAGNAKGGIGKNINISSGFLSSKSENAHDIGGGEGKSTQALSIHGTSSGIVITGGSIFADNMGTTPTGIGGSDVYKVTVPAVKTGTTNSLIGNLDISVSLGGIDSYTAKTVSTQNEHGSAFPADVAAYIYLPAGEHSDISVGSYDGGYADVKHNPTRPKENIILWDISVSVTFDGIGADEISQTNKAVTYGGVYGELPTATKAGYSFNGWFTSTTGGIEITSGSIVSTTSAHTLYAHWATDQSPVPKVYTITFDANGGNKLSPNTKKVTSGEKYGTLPTPIKKGNKFLGWYTSKTGGTKITSNTKVTVTKDQTFYARWQANIYIKLHSRLMRKK